MKPVDHYAEAEAAERIAKKLVGATPGFEDLASFSVVTYTEEEARESGDRRDWVGQYVRGSVNEDRGAAVLLRIEKHEGRRDMTDTLLHEMGHALWDLLDDESRATWTGKHADARHGAEEEFADDFMRLTRGSLLEMTDEDLFREITAAD